jgi:hypothetical protein
MTYNTLVSSNATNGLNTSPLYLNANNVTSNVNVNIGGSNSFIQKTDKYVPHLLMKDLRKPHYMLVGRRMRRRRGEMR